MSSIGPQLPPHLQKRPRPDDEANAPRDSPPPKTARRTASAPPNADEIDLAGSDSDADSAPGSQPPSTSARLRPPLPARSPLLRPPASAPSPPAAPRRDDWMLAPPTARGYQVTDPTKLKNRKFASGRSARDGGASGGVSSIWTETPEEKARRVANRVLGREEDSGSGSGSGSAGARKEKDRARAKDAAEEAWVREYTEQTRGRSLYEEHQMRQRPKTDAAPGAAPRVEEEDDPSKRAFDREKDMGLSVKISGSQRKELLNRAAEFGGRFHKGSYL
ncbi:hypothetical protein P8C59_008195 [Phyllachora maydis]|uniref:DUF3752 domain-containing protein n=1 Tax=Phyllachora maydis TaxID=1825666 RepID=A0AAD9IA43_9PEZI|nr:hypothetical protein P8C59_008195 [Phyllachora maydis]